MNCQVGHPDLVIRLAMSHLIDAFFHPVDSYCSFRYAKLLLAESKWSKVIYAYMVVAAMCMNEKKLTAEDKAEMEELCK